MQKAIQISTAADQPCFLSDFKVRERFAITRD